MLNFFWNENVKNVFKRKLFLWKKNLFYCTKKNENYSKSRLESILKVELLENESSKKISSLWINYHKFCYLILLLVD